ncbi:MAG: hypothetical protein J5I53_08425 [Bradyrhizobiaceae bacterium]|nr:hypothetical protein [Bradyrhizobiaceae bacterium]
MKRSLHLCVLAAFAVLTFSGFQCASSNLTAARKAIQNQDYASAKQTLEQALAANPNDCEALILLGDVARLQDDADGLLAAYTRALACPGITDKQRADISIRLYNAWAAEYNAGITGYNDYVQSKDRVRLEAAITHLENAARIKPSYTEPLSLLGGSYEAHGDTAKAQATYERWWMIEKPGFDIMMDKGVTLGMSRDQAHAILGKPAESQQDSIQGGGLIYKDKIDVGGRNMYLFSSDEKSGAPMVEGWTYNPPSSVSQAENWRARVTSLGPVKALAFIAYHAGNKERALEMANVVGKISPTDKELVPLRTQVLQDLGRTDAALKEIEIQLNRDPSNVNYRLQYATLLSGAGRNNEAIEQYNLVLKAEPSNDAALYNLAAAFKNIAGNKQRAELEKMDKDKRYQPDMSYMADLAKSAEFFEKLRSTPKYKTDIIVLEQLANVYEVTKEKAKVKALILELEGLEALNEKNKTYYEIMEGLYSRNNMIEKMKVAAAKAAKL